MVGFSKELEILSYIIDTNIANISHTSKKTKFLQSWYWYDVTLSYLRKSKKEPKKSSRDWAYFGKSTLSFDLFFIGFPWARDHQIYDRYAVFVNVSSVTPTAVS